MKRLSFSAVLLAAGRSTRMGTDKAELAVGGRLLWQRQWALLEQAGATERFLSVRPEQLWVPTDGLVVYDRQPDAGPLSGIAAALAKMTGSHLLVLAVDLPAMEPTWFQELAALCSAGVGVVGWQSGYFEPLAAIYPRELLGAAVIALAREELSLQHFIKNADAAMRTHAIAESKQAWFTNWNEPV